MEEVTLYTSDGTERSVTAHMDHISIIKNVANSGNRQLTKGVVFNEMVEQYLLRRHNTALNAISKQVRRNNSQLAQEHGTDIWGLTESHRNVRVDRDEYEGTDQTDTMDLYLPPRTLETLDGLADDGEFSAYWGPEVTRAAVEMYASQPFTSLNHVLEVQNDVLSETYDTAIGAWIENNSDNWTASVDAETPDTWGKMYQSHVSPNTPTEIRKDWLQVAFNNILNNIFMSQKSVKQDLESFFGMSASTAEKYVQKIDIDEVNREWYENNRHKMDSDIADVVETPTDLGRLCGENHNLINGMDGAPESLTTEKQREYAAKKATAGLSGTTDWRGLTFESRISVANEFVESEPEVGTEDVEKRMEHIKGSSGGNQ